MMKRLIIIFVVLSAGMLHSRKSYSQHDPMFTNYMWNEMYINPAYAGSREALSLVALHRQQWVGMDGAPITQTLSLHGPFFENRAGLGLSFLHEGIGVSNESSFMGTFAYHIQTSETARLSFGLSGGVITLREKLSEIETRTPGDVHFLTNTPLIVMPNSSFGMYYYTKKFYVGFSTPRMITNVITPGTWKVDNTLNVKNIHYHLISGYVFDLQDGIKLKPTMMLRSIYAAPIEISTSVNVFFKDRIWAGLAYRTGNSISVLLAVQVNPYLRFGYSYDYTASRLSKFNSGSHEINIGYDYPLGKRKTVSPRLF